MTIKKYLLALGCTLFTIFVLLQFNDATQYGNHDAWIWIFIYASVAVINAVLIKKSIPEKWLFALSGFAWGAFLFRIQDEQGNLHIEWLHPSNFWGEPGESLVQQANESGGLLILAIWTIITIFLARNNSR